MTNPIYTAIQNHITELLGDRVEKSVCTTKADGIVSNLQYHVFTKDGKVFQSQYFDDYISWAWWQMTGSFPSAVQGEGGPVKLFTRYNDPNLFHNIKLAITK